MSTFTTTAIATSSTYNTVTVASISNMLPGLPITFSGVTFGGITEGSTYYIRTITYGYPTSTITLSSLPGGAVYALTTDTGSMTASWESGGQLIIDTTPPGENLNSAFTKVNLNFDQIWAAGPVGSNIKIADNTIYTLDTNGELILNPNGIGNVVANAHVIPDTTNIRNLGSPSKVWNQLFVKYLEVGNISPGNITIPVGNLHILGGNAGTFLQTDGNGDLSWASPVSAAAGNNTTVQFNNDGLLDGVDEFTYDSVTGTLTVTNINTAGVANLNSVSNVVITGGVPGYVLTTDGSGNLAWTAPTGNVQSILDQQFFGDGSTVNFGLSTPSVTNAVLISINGVLQIPDVAYTVSNDVITFTEAPLTSDLVDIRFLVFGQSANSYPGGADGFIQFNSAGHFGGSGNLRYISATGNLYSSNVSVAGNITASYYYGNGRNLTGVVATASTGTITFANNIISTSNANATISLSGPQQTPVLVATGGNSATAQLLWATNIGALDPAQVYNGVLNGNTWGTQISVGNTGAVIGSNSVAGLKTWTFKTDGTLDGTGTVQAGTLVANVDVSAVGNISGAYVLGNGAYLTGIPEGYSNADVYTLLNGSAANVIPLANNAYSLGNATNQWLDLWVSNNTIYMNSVPLALSDGNTLSVNGNPLVAVSTGNVANIGSFVFNGNSLQNMNGVGLDNGDLTHGSTSGVNLPANGNTRPAQLYNTYGAVEIVAGGHVGNTAVWTFNTAGNIVTSGGGVIGNPYSDSPNALGIQAGSGSYAIVASNNQQQYVQVDDNTIYLGVGYPDNSLNWTFDNSGNITLPDTPTVSINYANGRPYGGSGGNVNTGNIGFSGNIIFNHEGNTQGMLVSPTLDAGNTGSMYLPFADESANLTIRNNSNASSGIELAVGSNSWLFDTTGNLTLPGNLSSINYANGSPYYIEPIPGNLIVNGTSNVGIPIANGNVIVTVAGDNRFIFDTTGNLTTANGAILGNPYGDNPNALGIQAGPGGYAIVNSADQKQFVQTDNNAVHIGTNYGPSTNIWTFDPAGNIVLPGNTSSINYANGQPYGLSSSYGDSNVVTLLETFGSNTISTTGNIDAGNLIAAGNVTGSFIIGDGRYLSNISMPIETGNITFNNTTLVGPSFGDVPSANNSVYIQPTVDSATTFQFNGDGTLTVAGNIANVGSIISNNASPAPTISGFSYSGVDASLSGNITAHNATFGGNINGAQDLSIDGNTNIGGNLFVTGNINFSGNVTQITGNSGVFYGNAATGVGAIYAGKIGYTPLPNTIVQVTGDDNAYVQTNFQNTNHGNTASMEVAITADDGTDVTNYIDLGIASSTWDGTQDNSLGDAVEQRDGYLYVQGGATGGNLVLGTTTAGYGIKFNAGGPGATNTIAQITATGFITTGDITAAQYYGDGGLLSNISVSGSSPVSTTGNVAGGNLITTGTVSATGNITANYFFGNASQLTGLPAGYTNANLANIGANNISTTGNISAGYLFGNASQLTGLPATYGNSNVTTLLSALGSNVISSTGNITTTANISGGNLKTTGTISSTGNVTSGNILTGGLISATGTITGANITGGNILTAGIMSSTGNATHGNILTGGLISAAGNVTAQNFIGNISITGNVTGTSSNVSLVAGSYTWTFDNTGNLQGNVTFTGANILINNSAGAGGSDEGGQLNFSIPSANTTLSGPIAIDVYQNKMRFFETTGNNRGAYLDLSQASTGVGTLLNNRVSSASLALNTSLTLDNLAIQIRAQGSGVWIFAATVSGTATYLYAVNYQLGAGVNTNTQGTTGTMSATTTPATIGINSWFFNTAATLATVVLSDTTNSKMYRVTWQTTTGSSPYGNYVSIERLV